MKKLKVLVIAEAANPEWVSVPLVGWSLSQAIAGVADAHLVTQIRNRDAILRAGLIEGKDFTTIDSERVARPLWKLSEFLRLGEGEGWTTVTAIAALSYIYFEHLVWQRFGGAIRNGEYDIVHRITPLSPTANSSIAHRCDAAGVPFVVGPLNGGVPWPKGFDAELRREKEWLSYVRGAYKALPGRSRMLRSSRAIVVGSRHTGTEIPAQFHSKCFYLPENAVDAGRFSAVSAQTTTLPLRACFIGRLVPYKGPDILLEAAVPLLRDGSLVLDIIGDGPMMADLQSLAKREAMSDAITFHGWIEHARVQAIAAEANLLTFPSIREFGGGVVLEAMALGVVPVVVDYAGPGELVTADTGFKIPLGTRAEIVARLRQTLIAILADPERLRDIGQRAKAQVAANFTWQRKAEQILRVYDWAINAKNVPPPDLFAEHQVPGLSESGRLAGMPPHRP